MIRSLLGMGGEKGTEKRPGVGGLKHFYEALSSPEPRPEGRLAQSETRFQERQREAKQEAEAELVKKLVGRVEKLEKAVAMLEQGMEKRGKGSPRVDAAKLPSILEEDLPAQKPTPGPAPTPVLVPTPLEEAGPTLSKDALEREKKRLSRTLSRRGDLGK